MENTNKKINIIFFDIIGTTIDWYKAVYDQLLNITKIYNIKINIDSFIISWRNKFLPYIQDINQGYKKYVDFDTINKNTLNELINDLKLDNVFNEDMKKLMINSWYNSSSWEDCINGLNKLSKKFKVIAFSNSGMKLLIEIVKKEKLPFDCILSTDIAQCYKPENKSYLSIIKLINVTPEECMMVACHKWDIDGAHNVGMKTAFVKRPYEKGPNNKADESNNVICDIKVTSFNDLAKKLDC